MSINVQIEERRRKIWDMILRGLPETVIANTLGVHRNTVVNDVRVLRDQHRREVREADVYTEIGDAAKKFDDVFKMALQEYSVTTKESAKGQFLEKAISALTAKVKLLVDVGVLPRAAQEITGKMVVEGVDVKGASLEEIKGLREQLVAKWASMREARVSGKD